MAAVVCPSGWDTAGRVRGCSQSFFRSSGSRCGRFVPWHGCHSFQSGERIEASQAARTPVPAPSTCVCMHPERRLHPQVVPGCDVQSRVYALGHYRDRRGACGGKGGKGESRPAGLKPLIWGSSQAAGRLRHESTRATGAVGGQWGGRLVASFPLDTPPPPPVRGSDTLE